MDLHGTHGTTRLLGWALSCFVSFAVGMAMIVPCTLIQKSVYGDRWMGAIGKGILLGTLIAIPTPIPSVITMGLTALGAVAMKQRAQKPDADGNYWDEE